MIINTKHLDGYINPKNIVSAIYNELNADFKEVQVSTGNGFFQIFVESKEQAEEIINKISNAQDNVGLISEKPETYIDGFKAGLEYALKIKETK